MHVEDADERLVGRTWKRRSSDTVKRAIG